MGNRQSLVIGGVIAILIGIVGFQAISNRGAQADEGSASSAELSRLNDRIQNLEDELAHVKMLASRHDLAAPASFADGSRSSGSSAADSTSPESSGRSKAQKTGSASEAAAAPATEVADSETPREKVHFKRLLDEVRAEEKAEAEQKREEKEKQSIRQRVEGLAEKLALSNPQVDEMTKILVTESSAIRLIFSAQQGPDGGFGGPGFGDGGDRSATFDKVRVAHQARETALEGLLDSWQIEEYKKSEQESRRRGPWVGGSDGRGGSEGRGGSGGGDRPR